MFSILPVHPVLRFFWFSPFRDFSGSAGSRGSLASAGYALCIVSALGVHGIALGVHWGCIGGALGAHWDVTYWGCIMGIETNSGTLHWANARPSSPRFSIFLVFYSFPLFFQVLRGFSSLFVVFPYSPGLFTERSHAFPYTRGHRQTDHLSSRGSVR